MDRHEELFGKGVDDIIDRAELDRMLKSGKKLRLKLGVDPSSPDLHLGHMVVLGKLRHLQDMGHHPVLIIGDFTAKIGDPSGRNITRPVLSDAQIKHNAKTYLDQAGKMLDLKKTEVRHNSEWLAKLKFDDLIKLASSFTVAQLIERDDFRTRLAEKKELGLHELLYPVMQAYDSVEVKADVEFGGSDQRFNILAGRSLMKKMGMKPQQVFLAKLLVGTDGVQKMSKSLGNYVGVTDAPADMYGKLMSIPDNLIAEYLELTTPTPMSVIHETVKTIAEGANPRDVKASLARQVVESYHGAKAAEEAEGAFDRTFRQKLGPAGQDETEVKIDKTANVLKIVSQIEGSNSAARRLIAQGGVKLNGQKVETEDHKVKAGDSLQLGKRRFIRLV